MSERDTEPESGEERIDESGRNPTQRRLDDENEDTGENPVDVEWPELDEEDES
jgi:hypothetical protein